MLDAVAIWRWGVARECFHSAVDDDASWGWRTHNRAENPHRAELRAEVGAAVDPSQAFPDVRPAARCSTAQFLRDRFFTGAAARDHRDRNPVLAQEVNGFVEK